MSGGSYDYAYLHVQDFAGALRDTHDNPLRRAFAKHLLLVAKAMHDIEWVDSNDYGVGEDAEAIRKCLASGAEYEAAREQLETAVAAAQQMLERAGVSTKRCRECGLPGAFDQEPCACGASNWEPISQ